VLRIRIRIHTKMAWIRNTDPNSHLLSIAEGMFIPPPFPIRTDWEPAACRAVLRIHYIFVRIRIRGSMSLTNESESFSAYYFLKEHLHPFFKDRKSKRVTKQ